MLSDESWDLTFTARVVSAKYIDPDGKLVKQPTEIRTNPLTGRTCRIASSRTREKSPAPTAFPRRRRMPEILQMDYDPRGVYMAVTQNHLPSAGGYLIHPHLQINADRLAANHHRVLLERLNDYYQNRGNYLFSSHISHEKMMVRGI